MYLVYFAGNSVVVNWCGHWSCRLSIWLCFWLDCIEVSTE